MTLYCPHCGQRVLLRLGVHLSPRRADVFDAIKLHSKHGGIRSDHLAVMFRSSQSVKVHISHINKLLAPSGWAIVCYREGSKRGFYVLRRVRKKTLHKPSLDESTTTDRPSSVSLKTKPRSLTNAAIDTEESLH